jgi:hypothetical protein
MGCSDRTAVVVDGEEVNGMAARKPARRAPTRRKKQRSWRIPKVLLFLSYSAALVALGSIFFMKTELQRFKGASHERAIGDPVPVKGVSPERAVADSVPEKNTPDPANKPKSVTRTAAAPQAGEITSDEKKQLENILRSRSGQ